MKENCTSFTYLNQEMKRKGIRMEDLSGTLRLTPEVVEAKLTGRRILFLDEAVRIRNTYFPVLDLRYLFARRAPGDSAAETGAPGYRKAPDGAEKCGRREP